MKKTFTKIFVTVVLLLVAWYSQAQVNVTYKVDVTNYKDTVSGGVDANGIRVGGNFTTLGAVALPDWTPSAAPCALTDEGNNVWSITVSYPATAIGQTQLFKFVNGDWGKNEGLGPTCQIATGGCGTDDGAGNINRTLVIPDADVAYQWCWDMCTKCDGSSPLISGVETISTTLFNLSSYPNPAYQTTLLSYSLPRQAKQVTLSVYDQVGRAVAQFKGENTIGVHNFNLDISTLQTGLYYYTLQVDNKINSCKFVVVN